MRQTEKLNGARGNPGGRGAKLVGSHAATPQTLADRGISKTQSSRWQQLADVPEEQFEAALAEPDAMPTTTGILAAAAPAKPRDAVDTGALWLWGLLLDFEEARLCGAPRRRDGGGDGERRDGE